MEYLTKNILFFIQILFGAKLEAVILVGGQGTRMKSVSNDLPKSILEIQGTPFLVWLIKLLEKNDVKKIILCLGIKSELIIECINKYDFTDIEIIFSVEQEPLGTGGALLHALNHISNDNLVFMNGDTMFDIPVKQLYSTHKNKNNDLTYSLSKLEIQHTEYGGLSLDNNGKITEHIMGKSNSDNQIIDAGLRVVNKKSLLEYQNKQKQNSFISFEDEIAPWLINNKNVSGELFDRIFFDIGNPKSYSYTTKYFAKIKNKIMITNE